MKKIFTTTICLLSLILLHAQTAEVKINPIGALFGNFDLSGEYFVSESFGAELSLGLVTGGGPSDDTFDTKRSGFGVMGMGKYYFNPEDVCDKFFAGLYLRQRSWEITADDVDGSTYAGFKRSVFAGGFALGYKWAGAEGIVFELAAGGGRAFSESNEWTDADNEGEAFPDLGVDFIGRLALGYRF